MESFATTQALAHDRQRWRQLVQRLILQRVHDSGKGEGIRNGDRNMFVWVCVYMCGSVFEYD